MWKLFFSTQAKFPHQEIRRNYSILQSVSTETKNFPSLLPSIYPFSTNVPLKDKPGRWFLLAKCWKNTCGTVTDVLHLYLKCHSNYYLVTQNQLPGFYIIGTLFENELTKIFLQKTDIQSEFLESRKNPCFC